MATTPVPTGNDVQVNTSMGTQGSPTVTALEDGGFVVAWDHLDGTGAWSIRAQRYAADGSPAGVEFQVNTTVSDQVYEARVTALGDGGFLVTWSSNNQDGSGFGVYAQRYAADGALLGSEFQVNAFTLADQQYSKAAALADGGFVITWSSNIQDGSGFGIYGQRYAPDGTLVGAEFQLNTDTAGNQIFSSVAGLSNGGFVATWVASQSGGGSDVYARRYAADGSSIDIEFRVNSFTSDFQEFATVAALSDGGFVISWSSRSQDLGGGLDDWGVYAQRYASDGSAVGSEIRVNTHLPQQQLSSSIAALDDGGFVITWTSAGQDGSGNGIYGQRFAADGTPAGSEFRINQIIAGDQSTTFNAHETVTTLANGDLVQVWSQGGQGVIYRLVDTNSPPIITSADEFQVAENTTSVTTVTAMDPDLGQPLVYSIAGGADAVRFSIDGQTGALSFVSAPNFEAPIDAGGDNVYEVVVEASDGNGGTDTQPIAVTVTNQNDAPVITTPPGIGAVQEDVTLTATGTMTAADEDAGSVQLWSVVGGNASTGANYSFAMDRMTWIKNGNQVFLDDFADDLPPPSDPDPAAVNGYGTNGAFTEAGGKLIISSSGAVPLIAVGTPDPFIGQGATLLTNIDPSDLVNGFKSDDDFTIEGRFDLIVPANLREAYGIRFTDRLQGGSGTPPDQPGDDIIELVVRRGNDGIVRVQLIEFDFVADTFTSIAGAVLNPPPGADQIILRLSHSTSDLGAVVASFDYLAAGVVVGTQTLPVVGRIFGTETPGNTGDDENWTRAQIITYSPQLTDSSLTGTYGTLAINQAGQWTYSLAEGQANVQALAAGAMVTDDFTVRVSDGSSGVDTQVISVTVTGTNDAPTDILLSASSVSENAAAGTVVGDLSASDVDTGATATFALIDDAGGRFTISGDQIVVAAGAQLDYEQAQSHQVTVRADDGLGGTFDEVLTITVADVMENAPPVITSDGGGGTASVPIAENTTAVTTVVATDPDAGETLTYAIVGGADAARFTISASTGALAFLSPPNFEAPADADADNIYDVTVQVSDGNGGTDTQAISVTVADIDDMPPQLVSIVAAGTSPTNAAVVYYTVTFSEAVTGVAVDQFSIVAAGLSGAFVSGVTPVAGSGGTQYTVAVDTGTGDGTVALRMTGAGIRDLAGNGLPGGTFTLSPTQVGGFVAAAADLNGDGKEDLISLTSVNTISVLLGNGDGTFQSPVAYTTASNPNGVSVGDLDGDGHLDLAVSNYNSNGTISVLLGNGDGTFQPNLITQTNSDHPASSTLADVNGDDRLDLIVANTANRGGVSVLLGDGDGTFTPSTVLASNGDPVGVAAVDLNGDGAPDVAFANAAWSAHAVQIYLNNGDGTFQAAPEVQASGNTLGVAFGDLNGDGSQDIAFTDLDVGAVSIALGNGDGTFDAPVLYTVGAAPYGLQVRDINGDAHLDLVVANSGSSTLSVLAGNGDGTFQPQTEVATPSAPVGVLVSDLNGDGRPDVSAGTSGANSTVLLNAPPTATGTAYTVDRIAPTLTSIVAAGTSPTNAAVVYYTVTFSEAVTGVAVDQFSIVAAGLSGAFVSGVTPVAGSGGTQYTVAVDTGTGDGTVALAFVGKDVTDLLGNPIPGGTFPTQEIYQTGVHPRDIAIGDVNGDGKDDLLVTNEVSQTVSVLLGNGDGTFQPQASYAVGAFPLGILLRDINGDAIPDIITANYNSDTVSALLGNGDGTFQPQVTFQTGDGPGFIAAADLDGDGVTDLVSANQLANTVSVLLGNGDGTFQAQSSFSAGNTPAGVAVGDLDADGHSDVVVTNRSDGTVSVLLSNGDGTLQPPNTYSIGSDPTGLVLSDINDDGKTDLVSVNQSSNSVSVLLGNGDGTFQPQSSYATGSNPYKATVADVNGDGISDVLVANYLSSTVSVLFGNSDGTLQPQVTYTTGAGPFDVAASDLDGDGRSDIVITNVGFGGGNTLSVLLNNPSTIAGPLYTIDKNDAPTITSDGGGETAANSIAENATAVTTVVATDLDASDTLTYSIAGGADAALFTIDAGTGALSFVAAPDFEAPADADADNVYEVTVEVSDGNGGTDTQVISVTVTNVGGVTIVGTAAANTVNGTTTVAGQPLPTGEEDAILGNGGADNIDGLGGNDTITGGPGNDTLNAGAGDDTFLYTIGHGADVVNGGAGYDSLIVSGTAGNDTLSVVFSGGFALSGFANGTLTNVEEVRVDLLGGVNTLSYAGSSVSVTVDLIGGVASGIFSIENVANAVGGSGVDALIGDDGNNILNGGAGDDQLSGFLGNDTLIGGSGSDTLYCGDEPDAMFIDLAAGTLRRGSAAAAVEDTLSSIENVFGSNFNDEIIGNNAANDLWGGTGDDTLIGAGGNDVLQGFFGNDLFLYTIGQGADTVDGGAGFDIVVISGTASNNTLSAVFDGTALTSVAGGTLTGIESVTAALDTGTDTLNYSGTTAAVTVDLYAGTASGFAAISVMEAAISGIENVVGGAGNDMLTGAAGVSNTLTGGAGNDTFVVHDAGDTASELAGGGIDEVRSWANAFTISDADVENLTFIGTGNFVGTGNDSANVIVGGVGNDTLSGAGGDDRINGGAGSDGMAGGSGNDTFVFLPGFGNDVITGFDANPTGGQDLIELAGLGITSENFGSRVVIEDAGTDTLVTVDGDPAQTIRLLGIGNATTITVDDFRFV